MTSDATLQAELMERFAFDANDLDCNRAGEYSESQLTTFKRKRMILPVGAAIVLAIGLCAGWFALTDRARRSADFRARKGLPRLPNDWSQALLAFAIVSGIFMLVVLVLWWRLYWQQIRRGPQVISGSVTYRAWRTRGIRHMVFGSGLLGTRNVIVGPDDEALISRIGEADVYWKQGTGQTDLLSIDVTKTP